MLDCHYDLLTYILMKKNQPDFLRDYCKKVYRDGNITGGIFNLFYMGENEMSDEIGMRKEQIDIIDNLKDVKHYIEEKKIIPEKVQYIFGIEGLDYLKNIDDIDVLYELGLRSTNPVWNNKNKFGGGIRSDENCGLTELGKELINKLVQKGIAIDLSHANEKTFFDIINQCEKLKKEGEDPIVFASHSNARALCNIPRNLTDEQILAVKELGGVIGVVSIKRFCINIKDVLNPNIDYEQKYIEHINYIKKLLGNIENIAVSTDDMKYYYIEPEYYQNANIYIHSEIKRGLESALKKNNYNDNEITKILETNFKEKILNRLKK